MTCEGLIVLCRRCCCCRIFLIFVFIFLSWRYQAWPSWSKYERKRESVKRIDSQQIHKLSLYTYDIKSSSRSCSHTNTEVSPARPLVISSASSFVVGPSWPPLLFSGHFIYLFACLFGRAFSTTTTGPSEEKWLWKSNNSEKKMTFTGREQQDDRWSREQVLLTVWSNLRLTYIAGRERTSRDAVTITRVFLSIGFSTIVSLLDIVVDTRRPCAAPGAIDLFSRSSLSLSFSLVLSVCVSMGVCC